jgi:hypothetical protein
MRRMAPEIIALRDGFREQWDATVRELVEAGWLESAPDGLLRPVREPTEAEWETLTPAQAYVLTSILVASYGRAISELDPP